MSSLRHKLLVATMGLALAQAGYARSQPSSASIRPKLLSPIAGAELVEVAFEYKPEDGMKPDCSHLVYEIYRQAGLNFRFASSRELYGGIAPFQRVRHPQSGDLIVWRGHVGIVVNPRDRSFYSSLRSGLMTDYYDTAYWNSRGTPRFYRYQLSGRDAAPPQLVRVARNTTTSNEAREIDVPKRDSSEPMRSRYVIGAAELPAKPSAEDFRSALIHHIDESGSALESSKHFDGSSPLLVVDDVDVDKVKLRKDQGSLEMRLQCSLAVVDGQVNENPISQTRKLTLRRSSAGWLVEDEEAPLYVPRQEALRIFATQLAAVTRENGSHEDVARLLKILNALAPE